MTINFITFGAGEEKYYDAVKRIVNQALKLNIFDNIVPYTDNDLKSDTEFWGQHSKFIENNHRGYGYWLWKPYIIKKSMEKLNDGDVLLYLDCGCELNIQKRNTLIKFFELVKSENIIGTKISIERLFNKMDLLLKLDMIDYSYTNSEQHQAGAIMMIVCDKTRAIVDEWYNIGSEYHFIDDSPSICENVNDFIEHRHDQSIFSLLTKKYGIFSNYSLYDCIEYNRNKSGIAFY
jgi:hypothetical protein